MLRKSGKLRLIVLNINPGTALVGAPPEGNEPGPAQVGAISEAQK